MDFQLANILNLWTSSPGHNLSQANKHLYMPKYADITTGSVMTPLQCAQTGRHHTVYQANSYDVIILSNKKKNKRLLLRISPFLDSINQKYARKI